MAKKQVDSLPANVSGQDWSVENLIRVLREAGTGDRVAALKRSGILTQSGKLAKRYRSWGKRATRTPAAVVRAR